MSLYSCLLSILLVGVLDSSEIFAVAEVQDYRDGDGGGLRLCVADGSVWAFDRDLVTGEVMSYTCLLDEGIGSQIGS